MFWNKNISSLEYWFVGIFLLIYLIYFVKIIYIALKMKVSARASFLKFLPRLSAFILLIIALLEPTFGNFENGAKINASNKIIYLLVDVSKSMDATDIAPSRLERVKNEIRKLLNYFPNERFGIIAFASEAIMYTPLTSDSENLKNSLSKLSTEFIADKGTNLVDALSLSLEKVKNLKNLSQTSAAVIIFTDGEDFADINENILNDFKRKRTNLLLVGIGTKRGINILEKDGKFVKNKNGDIVTTKLETEYLKTLATKTNGKYFEYSNSDSPLTELIKSIESQKSSNNMASVEAANPGNKYHYPLIMAILIICLDFLFTIRIFNF